MWVLHTCQYEDAWTWARCHHTGPHNFLIRIILQESVYRIFFKVQDIEVGQERKNWEKKIRKIKYYDAIIHLVSQSLRPSFFKNLNTVIWVSEILLKKRLSTYRFHVVKDWIWNWQGHILTHIKKNSPQAPLIEHCLTLSDPYRITPISNAHPS